MEKVENVVKNQSACERCTHEEVCSYKENLSNFMKSIENVEEIANNDANNMFSTLIRCKQYANKDSARKSIDKVKSEAAKEVKAVSKKIRKK